MTSKNKEYLRKIDIVNIKDDKKPMGIYTLDLSISSL